MFQVNWSANAMYLNATSSTRRVTESTAWKLTIIRREFPSLMMTAQPRHRRHSPRLLQVIFLLIC